MQIIKTALDNLNITYVQVTENTVTAQIFGVAFSITESKKDSFDLSYTVNEKEFIFTDQPWKFKLKGKVKKGIFMFFNKIKENAIKETKFYCIFPNYYLLSVKDSFISVPVPQTVSMTTENKLRLSLANLREEITSLRKINVELERSLAKERQEIKDILGVKADCEQLELDLQYRKEEMEDISEQSLFVAPVLEFV